MALRFTRKHSAILAGAAGIALALAACGGSSGGSNGAGATASMSPGCEAFAPYGSYPGTKVTLYSPIRDADSDLINTSFEEFTKCTGITVTHEGSGEFEAQLSVRVEGGTPPDIAIFPQPGLFKEYAADGKLKTPTDAYVTQAKADYSQSWLDYGTVDGQLFGAPWGASVKSFVWYSPKMFKDNGWTIPTTWDQLLALSDTIAATGIKPWCVGFESGAATGWPGTDWIEDIMLRTAGPEAYDKWVSNELKFDSPEVQAAFDEAAKILKNDKFVNGGYGDVKSIPSTSFQEGGLPILKGKCALHKQASFYNSFWPKGTTVAEDGDVFAFYFPANDGKPVLGGGEIVGQFSDEPQVQSVALYMNSPEYANTRVKICNCVMANSKTDVASYDNPINKLSAEILADPQTVFRFDASDLMPGAVGAGTFWTGMVDWINGASTADVTADIQKSWPSS
jgi:alpha-glucoside transport system substrate-binding protein